MHGGGGHAWQGGGMCGRGSVRDGGHAWHGYHPCGQNS